MGSYFKRNGKALGVNIFCRRDTEVEWKEDVKRTFVCFLGDELVEGFEILIPWIGPKMQIFSKFGPVISVNKQTDRY